jgi:excisionase family DNA binding protein
MQRNTTRQTLTIEEVGDALGINRATAYLLAQRNELPVPVIRLGRRVVVGRAALERVLTQGHDEEAAHAEG